MVFRGISPILSLLVDTLVQRANWTLILNGSDCLVEINNNNNPMKPQPRARSSSLPPLRAIPPARTPVLPSASPPIMEQAGEINRKSQ